MNVARCTCWRCSPCCWRYVCCRQDDGAEDNRHPDRNVTDTTGALVVHATVYDHHVETNISSIGMTNDAGEYRFDLVRWALFGGSDG